MLLWLAIINGLNSMAMMRPEQINFNTLSDVYHDSAGVAHHSAELLVERLLCWKTMPSRVLDLGAGTGFVTEHLLSMHDQVEVHALDCAESMLERVPKSARVTKMVANARSMPCRDNQYDAVLANMVLPWCAHWPDVFAEIKRVLRPGGMFLFTTLSPYSWQHDVLNWGEHGCWRDLPDMDVVGDVLLRQGYADTVMDRMMVTFAFDDVVHMRDCLLRSGWLMAEPLLGRRAMASDPKLTIEIIFGHTLKSIKSPHGGAEISVPLSDVTRTMG